jgi:uncharacterized protein YeeX (DUF496 family)
MSLSSLLNSNLLMSIGVAILMSGLVFYYCSSRFTVIEKGIQLQNKVLAEFIYNVQDELVKNKQLPSGPVMTGLASQKAVVSAETHTAMCGDDKIEISDDEEEDTDTESETDDVSDDASVEEVELNIQDNVKQIVVNDSDVHLIDNIQSLIKNNMMDVKVISMTCDTDANYEDISQLLERCQGNAFQSNAFQSNAFQSNAFQSNACKSNTGKMITEISNLEIVSSDSEDNLSDDESLQDEIVEEVREIKVEKKDAFEMLANNVDYKKMSVAELKNLVVERGLAINDNYKKMKKGEIIDLLMK